MKIKSNCHTHTQFCDGRNTAEEMVENALKNDFYSLGFSSHSVQLWQQDATLTPENEPLYRAEIQRLREKYKGQIKLVTGIERDLFSFSNVKDYEYYIASVHYLPSSGGFVTVDGKTDKILDYVQNDLQGNGLLFAKNYFDLLVSYARSYRPPIMGHFDLVRKNNARLHLYDENSSAYKDIALHAIEEIHKTGAMLEINTGSIARGYLSTPYPDFFCLKRWAELGGEVIVSSDCHDAVSIACAFDEMPDFMKKCGFDHVVQLSCKEALFERIAL